MDRIGEIKKNTFGTPMKIIAYRSSGDIDVEILDNHHFVKEHSTIANWNKGCIKNPYDRTVYGIGYVGEGKYLTKENKKPTPVYSNWRMMLERCYTEREIVREKYSSYKEVDICEEWLNFQNFARWYEENKYDIGDERLHLDKDIKYKNNKIYSPHHCILVPQSINEQFKDHSGREKKIDADLPYTVKRSDSGKYEVNYRSKYLGTFSTIDECVSTYLKAKEFYIKELLNKYNNIPNSIIEIVLNNIR